MTFDSQLRSPHRARRGKAMKEPEIKKYKMVQIKCEVLLGEMDRQLLHFIEQESLGCQTTRKTTEKK
jgi:hypothetical protein